MINVIIFVFVQTLFFWFILSQNIVNIATEATSYQSTYLKSNLEERYEFCRNIDAVLEEMKVKAEADKKQAAEKNIQLIKDNLLTFVLIGYAVLFLLMMWMFFRGKRYTGPDLIIIVTIFMAFSSEVFYYLFVLRQTKFISINQLVTEALYPYTTYEYPNVYPEDGPNALYPRTCNEENNN